MRNYARASLIAALALVLGMVVLNATGQYLVMDHPATQVLALQPVTATIHFTFLPEGVTELTASPTRLLEVMLEPLSRSLASAPVDKEEVTPETAGALDRAPRWRVEKAFPHEDILREFGLGK